MGHLKQDHSGGHLNDTMRSDEIYWMMNIWGTFNWGVTNWVTLLINTLWTFQSQHPHGLCSCKCIKMDINRFYVTKQLIHFVRKVVYAFSAHDVTSVPCALCPCVSAVICSKIAWKISSNLRHRRYQNASCHWVYLIDDVLHRSLVIFCHLFGTETL